MLAVQLARNLKVQPMKRRKLTRNDPFTLGGYPEDERPKVKPVKDRADPTHIIIGNIKAFNELDPDPLGPKLRERMSKMNLQVNLLIFFYKGPGYRDFCVGLTKETDAAWVRLLKLRYPNIKVEYLKNPPMEAPAFKRRPIKKPFDKKQWKKKAKSRRYVA